MINDNLIKYISRERLCIMPEYAHNGQVKHPDDKVRERPSRERNSNTFKLKTFVIAETNTETLIHTSNNARASDISKNSTFQ